MANSRREQHFVGARVAWELKKELIQGWANIYRYIRGGLWPIPIFPGPADNR